MSSQIKNNGKYTYTQMSATANIQAVNGILHGVFVSAASSTPTITVYDSATTTTTTKIIDTFTPAAATYYNFGDLFAQAGIYVVISGTVSATFSTSAANKL